MLLLMFEQPYRWSAERGNYAFLVADWWNRLTTFGELQVVPSHKFNGLNSFNSWLIPMG